MAQPTQHISPLRQRMIEDMRLRKLAPKTQASYICAVKKLSHYLATHRIPRRQKTCAGFSYT